jgi:hypothetical protein
VGGDGGLTDEELLSGTGDTPETCDQAKDVERIKVKVVRHKLELISYVRKIVFVLWHEGALSWHMFWNTKRRTPLLTGDELAKAIQDGAPPVIVDVRGAREYRNGHLPGAIHIPFDELSTRAAELNAEAPTVFY